MSSNKRLLNLIVSELVILAIVLSSVLRAAPLRPATAARPAPPVVERQEADTSPPEPSKTTADSFVYLPLVAQNYMPPAYAQALVEPGVGGQVGSPDGKVRVLFSPEAVTQTVIARYTPTTPPALPPGYLGVAGPAFDISAQTLDGTPVHNFPYQVVIVPGTEITPAIAIVTPTVTIQVRYTSEDVWGLDLRELFLYTRDEPGAEWVRAPSAADQERQLLVAEVEHLSEFVPMAPLAARFGVRAIAARNRLALDPDDDVGWAVWPSVGEVREGPMAFRLAQEVRQRFEGNDCHLDILVTRDSDQQRFVPRTLRAELARNFEAEMFTTLAFNALTGSPWGYEGDGGVRAWARSGHPEDDALAVEFFNRIQEYTGRPHTQGVHHPSIYGEFNDPSVIPDNVTYAHIETLFLDHNYDWPVIDTEFSLIVDAAYAALATRLADMGLTCGEDNQPPPLPDPPSTERLQRLRDLGYQNYQRYGADPVSFSTGNHVVQVRLTRIPGRGGLDWDLTLTYNAQDGRDDLFGYGWSWPYNAHAQHYSDDSVGVTLSDGRAYHYTWNGSGYDAPAGVFDRLEKTDQGWQWITPDDVTLTFSETVGGFGILTAWQDRNGNTLHFSHDLSGQNNWQDGNEVPRPPLTAILNDAGRAINVTSNDDGHITRLDLWDGRAYTFEYDSEGGLARINGSGGQLRRFEYDERHRMTKEWDAEDIIFLQNVYDDRDRVIEQVDASGTHSYLSYDVASRQTTFTDNAGNTEIYDWDELNRVTGEQDASGSSVSNTYDADYNLTARTNANGNTTHYDYDGRGNVTARYDPIPHGVTYETDVTRWAYDDHNRVISMTNALGHTWQYEYDEHGNLIRSIAPGDVETTATYNAWGQPTSITDAENRTTHYEYDNDGNLIKTTYPDLTFSASTYDAAGRETAYTDANGHTVEFEYDDRDNITRITDPKDAASAFEYDGNDLLTRAVNRRGDDRLYRYDENLKLIAERDEQGLWTYYGYDALYRRVAMTDTAGFVTRYAYDEAGKLIATTDPSGATTHYMHDANGNVTAVTDALNHTTRMVYDAANRLKYLIDANGNRTEYCYDAEDQLVRTLGPRGEVTDYTYDALGRLIAVQDPLGNVTRYEHDKVGNRTAMINPLDERTEYAYDDMGRVIRIAAPELADSTQPTTQFAYDPVGNTLVITSPNDFATTFIYDDNDNVTTITDPLGGQTRYTYTQMYGLVKGQTIPEP
jgi:YD repeat-containing protein